MAETIPESQTTVQLDYFYGMQADMYAFLRIPKILIKDGRFEHLSNEAKMLFGLLLDRMSLSMKNRWFDEENRVYIIYTKNEIMIDLGVESQKCSKLLKELDTYGLIERVKQGFSKPDIIYLKNFATLAEDGGERPKEMARRIEERIAKRKSRKESEVDIQPPENDEESPVIRESNHEGFENQITRDSEIKLREIRKSNHEGFENQTTRDSEIELREIRLSNPNNTDINNTDHIDTDISINQSVNLSFADTDQSADDGQTDGELTLSEILMEIGKCEKQMIIHTDMIRSGTYHDVTESLKVTMRHDGLRDMLTLEAYEKYMSQRGFSQEERVSWAKQVIEARVEGIVLYKTKEIDDADCDLMYALISYMGKIIGLGEHVVINGSKLSPEYLSKRFFELDRSRMLYILKNIRSNTRTVRNKKSYYIQCILNAESESNIEVYDDVKHIV